jgi:hypothetical protein
MDAFSVVILERSVELAIEAMPPDQAPRVAECASTIRQYIESPNSEYDKELYYAVADLLRIARENRCFSIAARLSPIAQQLAETFVRNDVA